MKLLRKKHKVEIEPPFSFATDHDYREYLLELAGAPPETMDGQRAVTVLAGPSYEERSRILRELLKARHGCRWLNIYHPTETAHITTLIEFAKARELSHLCIHATRLLTSAHIDAFLQESHPSRHLYLTGAHADPDTLRREVLGRARIIRLI